MRQLQWQCDGRPEAVCAMKIIFSRKGVDSASGGIASPIFEDGRMVSLPIPQATSPIRYGDIQFAGTDLGRVITRLSNGRHTGSDGAHCDPDINRSSLERHPEWCPLFGQTGNAQGHLRTQGVSAGDIFLFFGWFRDVHGSPSEPGVYKPASDGYHVLWGWLQVGAVLPVDETDWSAHYAWSAYHPHRQYKPDRNNTLYLAAKNLSVGGDSLSEVPGGGIFDQFHQDLLLTDPSQSKRSVWRLPSWFYPSEGKTPLTFHGDPSCWEAVGDYARLKTVGRGQEFVLDCNQYPDAERWARSIIQTHAAVLDVIPTRAASRSAVEG